MHTIELRNISKVIKNNIVLSNINYKFESGKVYGLKGRNGSGKSMLLRTISGLIRPTSGSVIIDGKELHKEIESPGNIGIVVENAGLYPDFTGFYNLKYLAGIMGQISDDEIINAIKRVELDLYDKKIVKKYSLGMKQKIVIAQAIMEKPDFLLLDEPTNALDESGVKLLREIVQEEATRGALVIIASHNQEDIELLCDKVIIMADGKISDEYVNSREMNLCSEETQ